MVTNRRANFKDPESSTSWCNKPMHNNMERKIGPITLVSWLISSTVEEIIKRSTTQTLLAWKFVRELGPLNEQRQEIMACGSYSHDLKEPQDYLWEVYHAKAGEGSYTMQRISAKELPTNFRSPQLEEYNSTIGLDDYLCRFKNVTLMHQYLDGVKFWFFLMTLTGLVQ